MPRGAKFVHSLLIAHLHEHLYTVLFSVSNKPDLTVQISPPIFKLDFGYISKDWIPLFTYATKIKPTEREIYYSLYYVGKFQRFKKLFAGSGRKTKAMILILWYFFYHLLFIDSFHFFLSLDVWIFNQNCRKLSTAYWTTQWGEWNVSHCQTCMYVRLVSVIQFERKTYGSTDSECHMIYVSVSSQLCVSSVVEC